MSDGKKQKDIGTAHLVKLRKAITGKEHVHNYPPTYTKCYDDWGDSREEKENYGAKKVFGRPKNKLSIVRQGIIRWIIYFFIHATLHPEVNKRIGKGLNLARYPYLCPTPFVKIEDLTNPEGYRVVLASSLAINDEHLFGEQYLWDLYPHAKMLDIFGLHRLTIGQLLNFAITQKEYGRNPNALTTEFLNIGQPPILIYVTRLLLDQVDAFKDDEDQNFRDWYAIAMESWTRDLVEEWLDYASGRVHARQGVKWYETFGILTRHVNNHYNSELVGCESGLDHSWSTTTYGENMIPVQLNCLIYANAKKLAEYYHDSNPELSELLCLTAQELKAKINEFLWLEPGEYVVEGTDFAGFRNFSIEDMKPILYGDLSTEIFPLFTEIATPEQAEVCLQNMKNYYETKTGLAATSLKLRKVSDIRECPPGYKPEDFQWELNEWAPLMMIAVEGLQNYGNPENPNEFDAYATHLMKRWVMAQEDIFEKTGVFWEKIDNKGLGKVNKGLYGNLPGFGWSIASYVVFVNQLIKMKEFD